jgi:hypothetical protein
VTFRPDSTSAGIVFALGISVVLHGLLLWVPNIELPQLKPSLPPLVARLESLPSGPVTARTKRHTSPTPKPRTDTKLTAPSIPADDTPLAASSVAASEVAAAASVAAVDSGSAASEVAAANPVAEARPITDTDSVANSSSVAPASSVADSSSISDDVAIAAASAPQTAETLAQPGSEVVSERPPLPLRAQLVFDVYKGTGDFKIGKVTHTLERDDEHYVLQAVTETIGLAKLIKTYKLTQYSSGRYSRQGLQPEHFFEERAESSGTQRNTLEFDYSSQRALFSHGGIAILPPDTQDILSILYQMPMLAHTEVVTVSVSNGKKIERYEFEIIGKEHIRTAMGDLYTAHLRKLHRPGDEGLEIWLALEYCLFPAKMRIIARNGEVSADIVVADIRAEFEQEAKRDVDN